MAVNYEHILNRFKDVRVMVVGDYMHDHYRFGRIERLAPEAPVPIFIEESDYIRGGGAMNVVNNLHALGCAAELSSFPSPSIKTRYMVGHSQVFRIDQDLTQEPMAHDIAEVILRMREFKPHAVVLSDYAKGWVNWAMAEGVIRVADNQKIPVIVDPKGQDWGKYIGATVICPNEQEFKAWKALTENPRFKGCLTLLVKLGEKGAVIFDNEDLPFEIPARAKHVYDVTGAGDTVVATVAAAMGAGATLPEAAQLAMITAGYVVGEVGTAVCPFETLKRLVGEES